MNIIAVQKLMGHANIDSTMVYLHVCRLPEQLPQSPLKVAISNHRIQEVNEHEVSFSYKDYKAGGSKKQMTLRNEEFVRRFSQHILPKRFVRIRHYGSLSSHWKRGRLQALQ